MKKSQGRERPVRRHAGPAVFLEIRPRIYADGRELKDCTNGERHAECRLIRVVVSKALTKRFLYSRSSA